MVFWVGAAVVADMISVVVFVGEFRVGFGGWLVYGLILCT